MTGVVLLNRKIKRLVMYYKKHYETSDPFKIAEFLGIKVFFSPLGKYSGMYKYTEHTRCIFINSEIENENLAMQFCIGKKIAALWHTKPFCLLRRLSAKLIGSLLIYL